VPPPAPEDDEPPAAPPIADDWERFDRPYYGLIADGIHVHPTAVRMAYRSHPKGCILTTDCLFIMDPHAKDGRYPFRPGTDLVRKGKRVTLGDSATLVGSAVDLQTCVLNLAAFAGIPLHEALASVTTHPARMLGGEVERRKGRLERGFDADLVVLDKQGRVRATWVRGVEVWRRPE
jgi:N-acetylglucosamine-6-phosphate deacetylase